jgi:hypothetical protein
MPEPGIQVFLQGFHCLVYLLPQLAAEKLFQHRLIESLHKAVGAGRPDPGPPVPDIVKLKIELIGMSRRSAANFGEIGRVFGVKTAGCSGKTATRWAAPD